MVVLVCRDGGGKTEQPMPCSVSSGEACSDRFSSEVKSDPSLISFTSRSIDFMCVLGQIWRFMAVQGGGVAAGIYTQRPEAKPAATGG
jgi:hypothetical protein